MLPVRIAFQIIAGAFVFVACNSPKKETPILETADLETSKEEVFIVNTLNEKAVPEGLLILNGVDSDDDLEHALQDNLYGKFFADQAEFFVVDKPLNKIHGSSIQSITLFYLDGQLSQTKYILDTDISEGLIRQFGTFRIMGLDNQNKELIRKRQVMLDGDHGRLNSQLNNYEITWMLGSHEIKYRVSKNNEKEKFKYVERMGNYERMYKTIERSVN